METKGFEQVAEEIIKEAINNAVFIDDKARQPFSSQSSNPGRKLEHKRTVNLYEDFRKHNCLMLPVRYTKAEWKRHGDHYMSNKDLLILDWQLVGEEHEDALRILDDAVFRKSLHFVCIYTQENLESVKNELTRYYLGAVDDYLKQRILEKSEAYEKFYEVTNIDISSYEWRDFEQDVAKIANAKMVHVQAEFEAFSNKYEIDPELFKDWLKELDQDSRKAVIKFKACLSSDQADVSSIDSAFSFLSEDFNTMYVNHTIVKLFGKDDIKGQSLYETFKSSLMDEHNIFLTLMGLEMRNRFRENSAFIGKDLDGISEESFFYHYDFNKKEETPDVFFDFLREIIKEQVASFVHEKDLDLYKVLDSYYDKVKMSKKVADFQSRNNDFIRDVSRLNKFYNALSVNLDKRVGLIRFGDVFRAPVTYIEKRGGTETEKTVQKYFLCITALCDCLRPAKKLKNQYWFVEGVRFENPDTAIKGSDGKFVSFLKDDNEIIAIDWKNNKKYCVPFTISITDQIKQRIVKGNYYGSKKEFFLIGSLKENYAQRVANEAFSYPTRVGIDFVKKS